MKKSMKTLFILMVLSLFSIVGISTVKAAETASASDFNVICEPKEIEKGDKSNCYLVGKVVEDNTGAGIHGILTKVTTTHLNIVDFKAGNGSNTGLTQQHLLNGQPYNAPATGVTCTTQGEECYGFFTANAASPGAFKTSTNGSGVAAVDNDNRYKNFTVFGYFVVELDETATTAECGRLCVFADYAATAADYGKNVHLSSAIQCEEITPKITVNPTPVNPDTPETGSFVSIAVLVAGALIAIGAIAIAKKNNKIYKV